MRRVQKIADYANMTLNYRNYSKYKILANTEIREFML